MSELLIEGLATNSQMSRLKASWTRCLLAQVPTIYLRSAYAYHQHVSSEVWVNGIRWHCYDLSRRVADLQQRGHLVFLDFQQERRGLSLQTHRSFLGAFDGPSWHVCFSSKALQHGNIFEHLLQNFWQQETTFRHGTHTQVPSLILILWTEKICWPLVSKAVPWLVELRQQRGYKCLGADCRFQL